MLRRYVASFLLCGLFGFVGQFLDDTANPATHDVWIRSDLQSGFADDPHPFWLVFSARGLSLGTPYATKDGALAYPGLRHVPSYHPAAAQKTRWQELVRLLVVLDWLRNRGALGCRTAAISAFLGLGLALVPYKKRRASVFSWPYLPRQGQVP